MSGPTLHRASAVSFIAHLVFFVLVILFANRSSISTPKIYTVEIITPAVEKSSPKPASSPPQVEKAKTPPMKKSVTAPAPSEPKIPPKKTKKQATADAPKVAAKPAENKEDMQEYLSKKLTDLKSRQQDEQYKEEQLSRLESQKKLAAIRQSALMKGSQRESAENLAEAEAARSRILDEYLGKIQDSIYEVWVYPEMEVKGLEASIVITVMRDGRILIKRFATPSGNTIFDNSAVKALQKASPVEPPPFGKNMEELVINFIPYEK